MATNGLNDHDAIQSALSYTIGGSAILSPFWMDLILQATTILQFLTVAGGFILVVLRVIHDYKKLKK